MDANLVKTGYMRVVGKNIYYISYKEFLSYSKESALKMKKRIQDGELSLFCACSQDNNLELSITDAGVVRVKNNGLQEYHKHSCPKSIHYHTWINSAKKSIFQVGEEGQIIFNITMPSAVKSSASSSSSSASSKSNNIHTSLLEMISTLNAIAWEKQTFSKKKEIALANRNKQPQTWQYKNSDEFIRLIFGISNEIRVKNGSNTMTFSDLCYKKDIYYNCTDYRQRFFIYAEITKVSDFVESRKYQYVTLKLSSDKTSRTTVRIPTEQFSSLFADHPQSDDAIRILAGYVCRRKFENNDWMQLLKGFVIYTSHNGLYSENEYVASVLNFFSSRRLIFRRCYQPIESYGGNIPTLIIERLNGKNIIIDFVASKQMRSKRYSISKEQSEYEVFIFLFYEYDPAQIYSMITSIH